MVWTHANLEKNNKLCVCRRVRGEKTEEKEGRKRERVCVYCACVAVFMGMLARVCASACGGQRATLGVVLSTVYSVHFSWDRVSHSLSGLELSYELGLLVPGICVSLPFQHGDYRSTLPCPTFLLFLLTCMVQTQVLILEREAHYQLRNLSAPQVSY